MDEQVDQAARKKRASNSSALIALGGALFLMGALILNTNPDNGGPGAIMFALLGVGLIVAGIVTRPRG